MVFVTPHTWSAAENVTARLLEIDLDGNPSWLLGRWGDGAAATTRRMVSVNAAVTASRTYYLRAYGQATISKVRLRVGAQAGSIVVAVYDTSGAGRSAVPNERVSSTGIVDCPAVGIAELALTTTASVTDHWFAIACSAAAGFASGTTAAVSSAVFAGFGYYQDAFPPPDTASGLTAGVPATYAIAGVP